MLGGRDGAPVPARGVVQVQAQGGDARVAAQRPVHGRVDVRAGAETVRADGQRQVDRVRGSDGAVGGPPRRAQRRLPVVHVPRRARGARCVPIAGGVPTERAVRYVASRDRDVRASGRRLCLHLERRVSNVNAISKPSLGAVQGALVTDVA